MVNPFAATRRFYDIVGTAFPFIYITLYDVIGRAFPVDLYNGV